MLTQNLKKQIADALGCDSRNIKENSEGFFQIEDIDIEEFEIEILKNYPLHFHNCCFKCNIDANGVHFNHYLSFMHCCFTKQVVFFKCIFSKTFLLVANTFNFLILDHSKFANWIAISSIDPQKTSCIGIETTFDWDAVKTGTKEQKEQLRASYEKIKTILVEKSNITDVSQWQRYILYIKELELDSQKTDFSKEETKPSLQNKIDRLQLFFYRNTSDHHTDTLKSFHTLIALIGVFGLLCGIIVLGFDYFIFDYKEGLNILSLKEIYHSHIKTSIQNHALGYFLGNLALIFTFLGLFSGVVWKCSRDILIPLGYVMTLAFLATSPKYLIPAMSLFGENRAMLDPLGIVGGIYTLLFGFLTYSFIKTIRKNSIFPS